MIRASDPRAAILLGRGAPPLATPVVNRAEVAIIQSTSGSTGTRRGVVVRHDSVAANTAAIAERFGLHPGSRAVSWLPPFHDMGLIGAILTPMAAAMPMRL